MKRLLSNRLAFGVIGTVLGTALGLAITGGFPDGMQDPLANAVRHVGINLPGGADVHPVATFPREGTTESGNAFQVPKGPGADQEKKAGYSTRSGSGDSCYASEACRAYFGLETDDPNEPDYVYIPPASDDEGGNNPGTAGEPGQPGIPDGGNDEPGESDGTPGEGGPAGDPG
jgi:hypothetical protein